MAIKTVGVLGCGLMGSGIAQISAASGFKTFVLEVNEGVLQKGLGRVDKFLTDGVAKGNKLFGAAILRKDDLSAVVAETNNELENPLWHGEVHALNGRMPVRFAHQLSHVPFPRCAEFRGAGIAQVGIVCPHDHLLRAPARDGGASRERPRSGAAPDRCRALAARGARIR